MQLQMTAPLDIGLEQSDAALGGQGDIFDLGLAEKTAGKKGSVAKLVGELDEGSDDSDEEADGSAMDEVDGKDEEARIAGLENELDGLYVAYKERLTERDSKAKAREARKNKDRDEWAGFGEKDSDEGSDGESEGGWDVIQRAKNAVDVGDSSDGDSDEGEDEQSENESKKRGTKRKLAKASSPPAKKKKLISNLAETIGTSTKTKLWFDQDIFKGAEIEDIEDDEEEWEDSESEPDKNLEESESSEEVGFSRLLPLHAIFKFLIYPTTTVHRNLNLRRFRKAKMM